MIINIVAESLFLQLTLPSHSVAKINGVYIIYQLSLKGPCTYDVQTEGGIGQQQGRLRGFSAIDQSQRGTRGEWVQKPETFADVISIYGPLVILAGVANYEIIASYH